MDVRIPHLNDDHRGRSESHFACYSHCYVTRRPLATGNCCLTMPSSRDAVLVTRYLEPFISKCLNAIKILETFRNATLTVTVTVRGTRRLWRHRIVCIWNAPNRRPNRKCQHMTVSATDNRTRFTVSGYAKFHQIFRENDIDLLYFNKQLSNCITHF